MKKISKVILSFALLLNGPAAHSTGFLDKFFSKSPGSAGGGKGYKLPSNSSGNGGKQNHLGEGNKGLGYGNTGSGNQGHGPNKDWAGNAGGSKGNNSHEYKHHESNGHKNPGHFDGDGCGNNGGGNSGGGNNGGGNSGGGNSGGGNSGGGNNGGGGNGEGNNEQQSSQTNNNTKSSKPWKWSIIPTPYIEYDQGEKVINEGAGVPDLRLSEQNNNYRIIKYSSVDFGLGISAVFHQVPATATSFMPMVGLLPIWGSETQVDRHVKSREEAKKLKMTGFPVAANEITSWSVGDSITYQSKGGVVFFAGAGIAMGFGGVVSALVEGQTITRVEKSSDTSVIAKITMSKIKSLRANLGNVIAAIGINKFENADKGFNYKFDTTNEQAIKAYQDFVNGNITTAQQMVESGSPYVQPVRTMVGSGDGKGWNIWLGIPILANFSHNSDKVYNHTESLDIEDDDDGHRITRSQIDAGIYSYGSKGRFFFRHANTSGAFVGIHYDTIAEEGPIGRGEVGRFVWKSENDHSTPKKLASTLKELIEITGLEKDLAINIPKIDDLGYMNVQFTADIDEDASKFLISLGSQSNLHSRISALGDKVNKNFIAQECQKYDTGDGGMTCVMNETRRVEFQLRAVSQALQDMYAFHAENKWPEFSKAYGAFGKAIIKSRYTFQTFLNFMKGNANVNMNLELSGEVLAKFRREIPNM